MYCRSIDASGISSAVASIPLFCDILDDDDASP